MMGRAFGNAALPLTLIALAGLAGCQPTGGDGPFGRLLSPAAAPAADAASTAPVGAVEEIEVEAPEVYSLAAQGLWDGRPSLGGVWVAHPDVTSPERVAIRAAGGGTVTGALFRRERTSAGPDFQISSEAATALGVPPGTAVALEVVALRREARVVAPPPSTEPEPIVEVGAAIAGEGTVTAEPLDPAIGAAVAAAAVPAPSTAPATASAAPPASPPAARPPADAVVVAPGAIDAPFVQVGFFSEEQGAEAAAARLGAAGIETRIALADNGARRLWRVVAGPAQTRQERDDLIAAIRAEGYERPAPVAN